MTFVLCSADCARENCLCRGGAEECQQNNRAWLEGLLTVRKYQNFLEEGKLVVSVASVACIVFHHCPIFMIFGILQEYCRKLLVLPDTFMYTTFS